MPSLTILGSTGSIGVSTLRVARFLAGRYSIYGLACNSRLDVLEEQIRDFSPRAVAVSSPEAVLSTEYAALKKRYSTIEFLEGEEGLLEIARRDVDVLVSAIVGGAGLAPTMEAIPHVRRIALANKETLVMAGALFMERIREHSVELLPVDSEHSALFLLLDKMNPEEVRRIILTASGGSLRGKTREYLEGVAPREALDHPTWDMGNKITIDSATLMNKGLEVIEAHHLFGMDYSAIDVVVHPESVVHAMVESVDGAVYAHMGVADMALPILNALVYPEKVSNPFGALDLCGIGSMRFMKHDPEAFPALDLCYRAGRRGGTACAVLNGANEACVEAFLGGKIRFTEIADIVTLTVDEHNVIEKPILKDILESDRWARKKAGAIIAERSKEQRSVD